jgi:hypothetical protein
MRFDGRAVRLATAFFWSTLASAGALAGPDFRGERASADVRGLAHWVVEIGEHQHRPFAIVDKLDARIYVFDGGGRLIGASAALLGSARGDRSAPGVGKKPLASLAPHERTTPAGRFASEPGHNDKGEAIVWIDYEAALAVHRLRPAPARQRRPQRLASPSPEDNRISLGCVVVPGAFYDAVVQTSLGSARGTVYVLPEDVPAQRVFAAARWD